MADSFGMNVLCALKVLSLTTLNCVTVGHKLKETACSYRERKELKLCRINNNLVKKLRHRKQCHLKQTLIKPPQSTGASPGKFHQRGKEEADEMKRRCVENTASVSRLGCWVGAVD